MNTIIIYDSQYGNTERIALSIADILYTFGSVRVVRVDFEQPLDYQEADLLILGSPTQGFRATPAMQSFVKKLPLAQLSRLTVTSFDTRIHGPWGSAARDLTKRLRAMGVQPQVPPISFFVKGTQGPLDEGETERAARWALSLLQNYQAAQRQLVAPS